MNAQTNSQVVNPVFSILATTSFNRQQRQKQPEKKIKKLRDFGTILHSVYDTDEDTFVLLNGCYGKDAKPVVGNVSSFNQLS